MDRRQRGKEALVVGRIGGVADAEQRAIDAEEATAAAALHGLAGNLHVRGAQILVDRRHAAVVNRRILTAVAADRQHGLARRGRPLLAPHARRLDLLFGENAHQRQVTLQIPRDQLAGEATGPVCTEEIDLDQTLAV